MNCLTKQVLFGSIFAFGLALTPAMAQHEGHQHGDHGHGHGDHQHAEKTSETASLPECPVLDEPINLGISVATDDGPVFLCCKGCIKRYQASPAKYATKVAAQRQALADRPKIQVTCPVSKKAVDPEVSVENAGKKVYFCCAGCVTRYESDAGKYASALANSYTYQTKCPVMGAEIDRKSFTTAANGMTVYFCCKGCDKKYLKDPAKYASKLAAQGFSMSPDDDDDEHEGHDHGSHDHGGHDHH